MRPHDDVIGLIGDTPMVRINRLCPSGSAEIWAKLEGFNPGGSVKDRIALSMIERAEEEGRLAPGSAIVEPTSGNTGIGLAMVAAVKGYRLILTMPDTMSVERRQLFEAYGARVELTPGEKGMKGAVERAEEIEEEDPGCFMPQQFKNPANPRVHRERTAREILEALGSAPDAFVAGVGTGGTITGVGRALREERKDVWISAVEPSASPVLSGGKPGPHKIAGIGAGFVPDVLETGIYDETVPVGDDEAARWTRELALKEGLLCGISSGAAIRAALRVAERLGKGKRVVVILPDRGDRYLSTGLFAPH
jgi:cysteine synthase A